MMLLNKVPVNKIIALDEDRNCRLGFHTKLNSTRQAIAVADSRLLAEINDRISDQCDRLGEALGRLKQANIYYSV
ncbi:MAG: hypothetical protein GDA56_05120 [Hormoscilla sp. GM7CHS1pb]|nr:hypothetical protein [Hormoscilla sp. GM7CHS1pb]